MFFYNQCNVDHWINVDYMEYLKKKKKKKRNLFASKGKTVSDFGAVVFLCCIEPVPMKSVKECSSARRRSSCSVCSPALWEHLEMGQLQASLS